MQQAEPALSRRIDVSLAWLSQFAQGSSRVPRTASDAVECVAVGPDSFNNVGVVDTVEEFGVVHRCGCSVLCVDRGGDFVGAVPPYVSRYAFSSVVCRTVCDVELAYVFLALFVFDPRAEWHTAA